MAKLADITLSADDAAALARLLADRSAPLAHEARDALAEKLLDAQIEPARAVPRAVRLQSRVVYEELPAGTRRAVVIVNPRDADAERGRISVLSPVGRALLGNAVGAVLEVPLPAGRALLVRIAALGAAADEPLPAEAQA